MSETRYDWLADRWVIFAPNRSKRPDEFIGRTTVDVPPDFVCPFCAGNERLTPNPVLVLPAPNRHSRRWQVRVVPNKFPALIPISEAAYRSPIDALASSLAERASTGTATLATPEASVMFQSEIFHGAHEVIIESAEHRSSLTELTESNAAYVFAAIRSRLIHWRAHDSLRYAVAFKNVGTEAGASLSHSHSQLIATSFVPPDVVRSCRRLEEYEDAHGRPYFEELIQRELEMDERTIFESENFVAVAPFASPVPYFMWLMPKKRQSRFEELSDEGLREFTQITRRMVKSLERLLPNASYNFVLHTSPFDAQRDDVFHWRMELFPRLTKSAGFEWGSECFINPVMPEQAARSLQEALGIERRARSSCA